jgi:hypothetical protein
MEIMAVIMTFTAVLSATLAPLSLDKSKLCEAEELFKPMLSANGTMTIPKTAWALKVKIRIFNPENIVPST